LDATQQLTDATGTIVWVAGYLPFGQVKITIETVENNLRYKNSAFFGVNRFTYSQFAQ
jgi:hypothetical protein